MAEPALDEAIPEAKAKAGICGHTCHLVLDMGLLGLFLNRRFLKLVLVTAAVFFAIRSVEWLASLVMAADPVALLTLLGIIFFAIAVITIRSERLKVLSGLMKLLLLIVIALVLVFDIQVLIGTPSAVSLLLEASTLACVLVASYAYRKRILASTNSKFQLGLPKRHQSLSKEDLLPEGIESGHVIFSAGRRRFRVLRFITIGLQDPKSADGQGPLRSTHLDLARVITRQLTAARRSGIEICFELCRDGSLPKMVVTLAREGRNYRECRASVDQFAKTICRNLDLGRTRAPLVIDDSKDAQRILLIPLLASGQIPQRIENDGRSAKVVGYDASGGITRLRVIRLVNLHPSVGDIENSLLDELTQEALATSPVQEFSCLLHIKPVSNADLNNEVKWARNKYQSAVERMIQDASGGLFSSRGRGAGLLARQDRTLTNATNALKEAKVYLERLEEAEGTGYFDVSLTITAEPANAEDMARTLKTRMFSRDEDTHLSIIRLPPATVQAVVRRDPTPPQDKLSGNELASLMISQGSSSRFSALNIGDL